MTVIGIATAKLFKRMKKGTLKEKRIPPHYYTHSDPLQTDKGKRHMVPLNPGVPSKAAENWAELCPKQSCLPTPLYLPCKDLGSRGSGTREGKSIGQCRSNSKRFTIAEGRYWLIFLPQRHVQQPMVFGETKRKWHTPSPQKRYFSKCPLLHALAQRLLLCFPPNPDLKPKERGEYGTVRCLHSILVSSPPLLLQQPPEVCFTLRILMLLHS